MKVIKRNGKIVDFDSDRIINAIENAMRETVNGVDNEISQLIAKQISNQNIDVIQIEQIQDMVEEYLMNTNRKDVAKRYILYRNNRNKTRNTNKNIGLLSEEFLSKYKHKPSPMNQLGNFVYYRTYSRWLPEEQRREYWWETVKRSVEYNCSLIPTSREEAEKLYDNIYNLRQFLSGRTLYIGGTLVSEKFPTSNYNCSFSVVDNFEVFKDAFYLLMIGSGFGFRILKSDVSKLPRVKSNIEIIHKEYTSTSKNKREDNTSIQFVNNNMIKITVGDSKGGWVQALDYYLKILWDKDFTDIETIIFIYDHVRPKGERLKTFGGTASGYESLKSMFTKVSKIIKNEGINQNKERIKLKPINCLDILNAIGENVVIGGVRRTSEIALINSDDEECIKAKNNLYKQTINGKWEIDTEMTHRQMSNNSIYYKEKPSREQIHWQIEQMRYSGEPAFVNEIAGNKRRPNFNGVNPCFTGDMKLLTVDGYKTFEELHGREVNIININGDTSKGRIWSNGEKDIIEIKLSNKQIIKCTPTHMFMLNNNEECEAQNLLNKRVMRYYGKTNLSNDIFVQLGFLQGDGGVGRIISESHKGLEINIGDNDKEIFDLFNIIPIDGKRTYYTNGYNDILIKYGFDGSSLPERVFPITYTNWTKEQKLNFLKGCYSANGCVIKTYRVSYKTTSKIFSLQLKKALEEFGITAYITTNKPKIIKFENGEYLCKESYDINIGKLNDIVFFYQNIGFMQQYKINDLIELIKLKSPKVITIKKLEKQKTYDFSEPLTHWGVVENIIVHNCAEILLDSNGLCNLTTINVFSFVENDKLNIEELLKAQKLSARSGYRMTCVELELPKWDAVQQRDKLTGCSLTGWQDMVNALSMSKEEEIELLKKLRQVAHEEIHTYSQELGLSESLLITTCKPEGCWTLDHIRTLDNGLLRLDEINENIEIENGFKEIDGYTKNGYKITKTYSNDIKNILKIKLKNGRELKITNSHPMSINGEWIKAQDIKIGNIIDYKLGEYKNNKHYELMDVTVDEFRSDIRDYKTPKYINEDVSWLIGAYMANGSFTTNNRIKFHCQHLSVHEKVQRIWQEQFGIETNIVKSTDRDSYTQDFRSTKIIKWLNFNCLDKEYNYKVGVIPKVIRQSTVNDIINFIIGYADNDGCFYNNRFCIDSINEPLMRHMQEIGEAIGISFGIGINSKRNSFGKNPIYKLTLSRTFTNEDVINYINKISVKAQKKPVIKSHIIRSANPYKVIGIEVIEQQKTYDIEIETEHWYYQGGLKSHNTLSQLPGVTSGVHYSESEWFVRRVRINSHDPLVKVCEELNYPIFPEVGQTIENCTTKVIEFPMKSSGGRTKYDVSAIEQLENYKMFMTYYVDHNASITVTVRDEEWEEVEEWVYNNWDDIVAVSFLSLSNSFYQLMPYEAITEEEYNKRVKNMKPFIPSLISKYEKVETEFDIGNEGCESGVCPIR